MRQRALLSVIRLDVHGPDLAVPEFLTTEKLNSFCSVVWICSVTKTMFILLAPLWQYVYAVAIAAAIFLSRLASRSGFTDHAGSGRRE